MDNLVILSVVLVSLAVPIWLSTKNPPARQIRRMRTIMVTFILVWAYLCLHWYPRLVPIQ